MVATTIMCFSKLTKKNPYQESHDFILFHTHIFQQVFQWADIYIHNPSVAEYCFYNNFRSAIEIYDTDELLSTNVNDSILIKTPAVKFNSDVLRMYLQSDEKPLFLLVGLSGSGKRLTTFLFIILNTIV